MSNGAIPKDMAVTSLTSQHMVGKFISSVEHIDGNIIDIEKDIFELQDVALQISDETLNLAHEVSKVQNDFIELQYIQSMPWFCKSNFTYQEVSSSRWNIQSVPESSNQLFIREIELTDTYTGMFILLPRAVYAGEARSASIYPKTSEACVFVTSNPNDAVRLTSFDLEWFPPKTITETDIYVGHGTLLSNPNKLNGYLFGSVFSSFDNTQTSVEQCVVFPEAGPVYIQSIYLDNNSGNTKIIFVIQKFRTSVSTNLPGFSFYGIH